MVKKKPKKEDVPLVMFKMCDWDRFVLQQRADKFTNGNISAWLRHVSIRYEPKSGERIRGKLR